MKVNEGGRPHPRPVGSTVQPLDQTGGQCSDGSAIDAIHQPLGDDQPVGARDQQRSPDPGHLGYPLQAGLRIGHL